MCATTHQYVRHNSFIRVTRLIQSALQLLQGCQHQDASSLLQNIVSFAEYRLFYRALLQKRPIIANIKTQSYVWSEVFICVPRLINMCAMTHLCDSKYSYMCHASFIYVWYDVFMCVPRLIHMCATTHLCDTNPSYVCHDSLICVKRLIRMCDLTHSYVCHDSFICVPWLIHICDTTHSYVWLDPFICVPWLIQTCVTTHQYVRHDSFIRALWLITTCPAAPSRPPTSLAPARICVCECVVNLNSKLQTKLQTLLNPQT